VAAAEAAAAVDDAVDREKERQRQGQQIEEWRRARSEVAAEMAKMVSAPDAAGGVGAGVEEEELGCERAVEQAKVVLRAAQAAETDWQRDVTGNATSILPP
jgi:hypothetical protein